ncbi:MAG: hypothetical protein EZS28_049712, partial [Streblomastix strix]
FKFNLAKRTAAAQITPTYINRDTYKTDGGKQWRDDRNKREEEERIRKQRLDEERDKEMKKEREKERLKREEDELRRKREESERRKKEDKQRNKKDATQLDTFESGSYSGGVTDYRLTGATFDKKGESKTGSVATNSKK